MEFSENKIEEVKKIVENKYKTKYPDKLSRYEHILGVAKMCKYLAGIYNVDESRAVICGLVHDFYKYESEDEMKTLIDPKDLDECSKYNVLYHSYASAEALSKIFKIDDIEMKNAIRYHVFGHTNMTKLEEIVLISDYTEENRQYADCIKCRNVLLNGNLDKAIYDSTKYVINFLLKKNIIPHPMQYEVLHEYERKLIMNKLEAVVKGIKKVNPSDMVCYDSNLTSPFFEFVFVASVDSIRQANQAVQYIKDNLSEAGLSIKSFEGYDSEWVLIDGFDFLVHIFSKEERQRVNIDKLYMDLEKIDLSKYIEE